MKTLLSLILLLGAVGFAEAQTMVGARGQASTTWMINKNFSDNNDAVDYKTTFTGGGGASIIQYLNETVGIEVGVGINTVSQRIQGEIDGLADDIEYETETSVEYLEIPILFKAMSEGGAYFEVGPMIGLVQSESESLISINPDMEGFEDAVVGENRVKDDFTSTMIWGVVGFGVNFDLATNLKAGVGLRIAYGFTDGTIEVEEEELVSGDTELGFYPSIAHTDGNFFGQSAEYGYERTTMLQGSLNLGIYYVFGAPPVVDPN